MVEQCRLGEELAAKGSPTFLTLIKTPVLPSEVYRRQEVKEARNGNIYGTCVEKLCDLLSTETPRVTQGACGVFIQTRQKEKWCKILY